MKAVQMIVGIGLLLGVAACADMDIRPPGSGLPSLYTEGGHQPVMLNQPQSPNGGFLMPPYQGNGY